MTVKIDFLISPGVERAADDAPRRATGGDRRTSPMRVPSSSGSAETDGAWRTSACGSISSSSSSVGSMKSVFAKSACQGLSVMHADRDAVRGIGAGEGVDDVDVALAQARGDLLAQPLEALLGDLGVDVAPPDPLLGARLADDELVLGRAAGVLAGVDDERPALGEPRVAARERVLVELRGRRVPEDVPAHRDPVLRELVPIGNDRDHEASCYADARIPWPVPASSVRGQRGECAVMRSVGRILRRRCVSRSRRSSPRRLLPPTSPTSRRSPSATRRSSGSSSRPRSAATASRTSRSTSTCSSASRPSRSAARGTRTDLVKIAPVGQGSRRTLRVPPRLPGRRARPGLRLRALGERLDGGKRAGRLRARRHASPSTPGSSRSSTGSSTPSTTSTTRTKATGR